MGKVKQATGIEKERDVGKQSGQQTKREMAMMASSVTRKKSPNVYKSWAESTKSADSSCPVWHDLAKFLHFGYSLQVFGKFLTVYFFFGKISRILWQICDIIGLFSLLQMAKYWEIILPSGHTDPVMDEGCKMQTTTTNDFRENLRSKNE